MTKGPRKTPSSNPTRPVRRPTYPAALRFALLIHELHRRPRGLTLGELARALGNVHERTIRRYAALCRSELTDHRGRPIVEAVKIAGRPGLRLADYAAAPEAPKYGVFAAYFALSLLRVLEGTAFRESADRMSDGLRRTLSPLAQQQLANVRQKLYSIPFAIKDYREQDETIDVVVQCLLAERRLRITYGDPPRQHVVEPYTLAEYRGGLYLLGRSHRGERIMTFAVERVRSAEPLADRFTYPSRYDPARHTEGTFGIIDGEETRVDLRILNADTLRYLRARRIHPTQRFVKRPDGSTVLSMRVRGTTELANWVLGHAPWIEVLRPRALREQVHKRLQEALATYDRG